MGFDGLEVFGFFEPDAEGLYFVVGFDFETVLLFSVCPFELGSVNFDGFRNVFVAEFLVQHKVFWTSLPFVLRVYLNRGFLGF